MTYIEIPGRNGGQICRERTLHAMDGTKTVREEQMNSLKEFLILIEELLLSFLKSKLIFDRRNFTPVSVVLHKMLPVVHSNCIFLVYFMHFIIRSDVLVP